jgi:hypothetical protein
MFGRARQRNAGCAAWECLGLAKVRLPPTRNMEQRADTDGFTRPDMVVKMVNQFATTKG